MKILSKKGSDILEKKIKTSSFVFSNVNDSRIRFGICDNGNVYSKNAQPAQDIFQRRIARLYNSYTAFSNKTETVIEALLTALAGGNEKIAVNSTTFPPLYNALLLTAYKKGIKLIEFNSPRSLHSAVEQGVKAVIMSSSSLECCNISVLRAGNICYKEKIPFIVDNTVATVFAFNPFCYNVDIVLEMSQLISAGDEKNSYITMLEKSNFNWMYNNRYSKLYPFRKNNTPLTMYVRSRCKNINTYASKEIQSEFYMLCEGLRTLENRINIYSQNTFLITKLLKKYSDEISYNLHRQKASLFLRAKILPEYTQFLKEKLSGITVLNKNRLFSIYGCTSAYFEDNILYIKSGTEPTGYLTQLFKENSTLYNGE